MNRLRILFLSLLILALVAGALPVTESFAKWSRRSAVGSHNKRHRRHSRAWWRRHRARLRAKRERVAELRRQRLEAAQSASSGSKARTESNTRTSASFPSLGGGGLAASSAVHGAQMSFGFDVPHNWTPVRGSRSGGAVFSVRTPDGRAAGTAIIAPVSVSAATLAGAPAGGRTKSVGGMPVTALRRTVINKMVAEGGWVTNDVVQEMHGRRVFVVIAQTGAPGAPAKSWAFYFTEIDGRVYSLATTAPVEFAEPVALGSQQFMASLRSSGSTNAASRK
ncbi:MAG TPA: hypothetical protein VEX60_05325 [Pyrinomonadaceae bacterium]|nr:hypothetical protein [Pyrinomonadaceae bacterium]